ncbi:MAG: MOSC domain-containing protein [Chromatiales bacterium]|nr:MOSC domain-containing protein [Chromatiales bacterium]
MTRLGRIKAIWRYPVKGMAGESLGTAHLDARGVQGDRLWAVQDLKRQEIQSCKFRPSLLQCRARCIGDGSGLGLGAVEVQFPGGEVLAGDDPGIHQRISALLGHDSALRSLRPIEHEAFYRRYKADAHTWLKELKATFEREAGEPPLPDLDNLPQAMQDYVTLPGTFFLVSPFHILTTASLAHMQALHPQSDWDIERFRPNLVIETLPGMEGLVEQAWLGRRLRVGSAQVDCSDTAPRCGAVTRQQSAIGEDKGILRRIVKDADQNLGIYADIVTAGEIGVGDEVFMA